MFCRRKPLILKKHCLAVVRPVLMGIYSGQESRDESSPPGGLGKESRYFHEMLEVDGINAVRNLRKIKDFKLFFFLRLYFLIVLLPPVAPWIPE